jgi:N-acetylmuramoyl-L-alanine amidase
MEVNEVLKHFAVFLDPGHGGLSPYRFWLPKKYVTWPDKCYQFKNVKGQEFHGEGWFFEGVWNRSIVDKVSAQLDALGIIHFITAPTYLDTQLRNRVNAVNEKAKAFDKTIFVSTHSNASPTHMASGFEVYSSPGDNASDKLAELHYANVNAILGHKLKMRVDTSDGDHDKEARFYVLLKTKMPSILIEHLFFDNVNDAQLLMREDVQDTFAYCQVCTIIQWINRQYGTAITLPNAPKLTL